MNITTFGFLLFLGLAIALYYCLPQRFKWHFLLLVSLLFVGTYKPWGIVFLILSSLSIWFCGLRLKKLNNSDEDKTKEIVRKKKFILLVSIFFNLGILLILKYIGSFADCYTQNGNPFSILIPLGLSYYTLQAIGYILDVYWERVEPEKSYCKLLLFLCYFPQMIQGPISRYRDLSQEIFLKDHSFDIHHIKHGVQLMLWGYFQVLVISDRLSIYVGRIFYDGKTAYGLATFTGFVLFGFQLYCNFSGGIDIIRGVSQCFDIELPQNFRQPFFSTSLGDFWRRWHITLGTWMKDYVFYPFSMSKPMSNLKKTAKKHISKKLANHLPIAIADIVVFLLVGIWHGTGTNYALWGLYNGVILAFSELMTDVYKTSKVRLNINESSKSWYLFRILRTFIIVTIGWCTDCATSAMDSLKLIENMLMVHKTNFHDIAFASASGIIFTCGILLILLTVSILHEKNIHIRAFWDKRNFFIQMIFWILVIQFIACFGLSNVLAGGFIYEDF